MARRQKLFNYLRDAASIAIHESEIVHDPPCMIFFFLANVLAHPGHGTPEAHFHQSPAVFLLTAVFVAALWRLSAVLAHAMRQKLTTTYKLPRRRS